jgi:YD repeat-containing protein
MGEHLRFALYAAREGEPTSVEGSGPRVKASGALAVIDGSMGHRGPLSREEFEQLLKPTDRDAVFTRHTYDGMGRKLERSVDAAHSFA